MNKKILAIDPGTTESGWILLNIDTIKKTISIIDKYHSPNDKMNKTIYKSEKFSPGTTVVIEDIVSYGMAIGQSTLDTAKWAGRFFQKAIDSGCEDVFYLSRPEIKLNLCHSKRAKDGNLIRVLKDRFGEFGTKKNPGPLYKLKGMPSGMIGHAWSALALAIAFININYKEGDKYKIE